MFRFILIVAFILINFSGLTATQFKDYGQFYQSMQELAPNSSEVYYVNNLEYTKDAGEMYLDSGYVCFLNDFGGKKHFAIFIGIGYFRFTPTITPEIQNLRRSYDTDTLQSSFKEASFVFDDDFYDLVSQSSSKVSHYSEISSIDRIYYDTYKHFMHNKTKEIYEGIAYSLLEDDASGFFYAQFFRQNKNHFVWIYDPYSMEENKLFIAEEGMSDDFDRITSFLEFESSADLLLDSDIRAEKKSQLIKGLSYDINFEMTSTTSYSSKSTYTFEVVQDLHWLRLELFDFVDIEYVKDENGKPVQFYYTDYPFRKVFWLRFDHKLRKGDTKSITVKINAAMRNRSFISGYNLYPIYSKDELLNFNLTASADLTKELHAFGELSEQTEDRLLSKRTTKWKYPEPLNAIGIMLWNYKEKVLSLENKPQEVVINHKNVNFVDEVIENFENGSAFLNRVLGDLNSNSAKLYELQYYIALDSLAGLLNDSDESVNSGDWILTGAKPYTQVPNPMERMQLVEERLQYIHRNTMYKQAKFAEDANRMLMLASDYPNMLVLPPYYFTRKSPAITSEYIARLSSMWMYSMRVKSYRDSWIETGLPMYLGMVYYHTYFKDKSSFFRLLTEIESEILKYKDGVGRNYSDLGALTLGYRADNLYKYGMVRLNGMKSVYVFHMLRNMFIDYTKGMNEDLLQSILRDYYKQFRDRKYSTEDLRILLEKHCGYSLKWFFDQWIDGTDIPSYKFASAVTKTEKGKYIVKCRIRQEDVPESFKMIIPIKVEFDNELFYMQRVLMQGKSFEFELGPFEQEPEDIEFNPFKSVLCNFSYESY
jgi:hypothetical protein